MRGSRAASNTLLEVAMRTARTVPLLAVAALMLTACNPVRVSTSVAPDANFASYRTFNIMSVPSRRAGIAASPMDPMLDNSITNRALRDHLSSAFASRGYTMDRSNPDFTVAYYASRRGKLDVTAWDYGYPGRWGGWRGGPRVVQVQPYVEGTVIVDVVNPKTHELVWRGRGVSAVSDDPQTYAEDLDHTVKEIVARFPGR
jgi:hypothetical protein